MSNFKFKVGDFVRPICTEKGYFEAGERGAILACGEDEDGNFYEVQFGGETDALGCGVRYWYLEENELEWEQ